MSNSPIFKSLYAILGNTSVAGGINLRDSFKIEFNKLRFERSSNVKELNKSSSEIDIFYFTESALTTSSLASDYIWGYFER